MLLKSIKYVGKEDQQCIQIEDPEGLFVTTGGIVTHNSPEKVLRTFQKTRNRVDSRMKNNYYGRVILDSSPNSLEDPIDQWINYDAPKNKSVYIAKGSLWGLNKAAFPQIYINGIDKPPVFTPENSFKISLGGNGVLPHIITPGSESAYLPTNLIDVPKTTIEGVDLYSSAAEDTLNFVRDQAGIPTEGADKVFYDVQKVENMFCDKLKNHYYFITAPAEKDPEHLIWDQIKDIFFYKIMNSYQFWYKPELSRTISIDQSISGDVTGIALSHVERDPEHLDSQTHQGRTMYITDFTLAIQPTKGGRINLDAIRYFIEDLVFIGHITLIKGSYDHFQSEAAIQGLKRDGIDMDYLSVDLTNDPYLNYYDAYTRGVIRMGRNILLKNNIASIREIVRKGRGGSKEGSRKYDHTDGDLVREIPQGYNPTQPESYKISWNTCKTGINAKDLLDAQVGSIELLRREGVVPHSLWEPEKIYERNYENVKLRVDSMIAKMGLTS
jgi:hypothetical protein